MSLKKRIQSFGYAAKGIGIVLREPNFRIQLCCLVLVVILAYVLDCSEQEWALLMLVSGLVLVSEAFNTALENLVDFVSPEHHEMAGKVKDIAAGAVLVSALTAVVMALIVFVPKLLAYV